MVSLELFFIVLTVQNIRRLFRRKSMCIPQTLEATFKCSVNVVAAQTYVSQRPMQAKCSCTVLSI